jgi:hypothetical protein
MGRLHGQEKIPKSTQHLTKHDRDEYKPEESNELQEKYKSKKQKSIYRDNLGFACHFNKRNPEKYCPWTDQKYLTCIAPSVPEFRRLM